MIAHWHRNLTLPLLRRQRGHILLVFFVCYEEDFYNLAPGWFSYFAGKIDRSHSELDIGLSGQNLQDSWRNKANNLLGRPWTFLASQIAQGRIGRLVNASHQLLPNIWGHS